MREIIIARFRNFFKKSPPRINPEGLYEDSMPISETIHETNQEVFRLLRNFMIYQREIDKLAKVEEIMKGIEMGEKEYSDLDKHINNLGIKRRVTLEEERSEGRITYRTKTKFINTPALLTIDATNQEVLKLLTDFLISRRKMDELPKIEEIMKEIKAGEKHYGDLDDHLTTLGIKRVVRSEREISEEKTTYRSKTSFLDMTKEDFRLHMQSLRISYECIAYSEGPPPHEEGITNKRGEFELFVGAMEENGLNSTSILNLSSLFVKEEILKTEIKNLDIKRTNLLSSGAREEVLDAELGKIGIEERNLEEKRQRLAIKEGGILEEKLLRIGIKKEVGEDGKASYKRLAALTNPGASQVIEGTRSLC